MTTNRRKLYTPGGDANIGDARNYEVGVTVEAMKSKLCDNMTANPCRNLRHVKENKSDVEVATFDKILGNFSPIIPPSATGVRSRRFRRWGHLVAGDGTF